jgi:hypothetical protein
LEVDCYAVDVKLPGIEKGDQKGAELGVKLVGLEVTRLIPIELKKASAGAGGEGCCRSV